MSHDCFKGSIRQFGPILLFKQYKSLSPEKVQIITILYVLHQWFVCFVVFFFTSHLHSYGHLGDVQQISCCGRAKTYVWLQPPEQHSLAPKAPHIKVLALTRSRTHAVGDWGITSQRF